ncbi:MAG: cupredoxin domain-containing protein [Armatimonadota bacterium]
MTLFELRVANAWTHVWLGLLILTVALVVTGCGGRGEQQTGGQPSPARGAAVNVTEEEWAIGFGGAAVKAGNVRFVIKNNGAVEHNFVIKELNVRVEGLQPGMTKEARVDLKHGTYTVVCDIPGHEEAGMKATLTVTE